MIELDILTNFAKFSLEHSNIYLNQFFSQRDPKVDMPNGLYGLNMIYICYVLVFSYTLSIQVCTVAGNFLLCNRGFISSYLTALNYKADVIDNIT